MELLINAALTCAGIAMLCFGGNWLVSGGEAVARKFRVSSMVIGMTVVAYGTSTPELAASIAALEQHRDVVLGNVIGSNIANVGLVVGLAAVMAPLAVHRPTLRREVPVMVAFALLLIGLSVDGMVSRYDGLLLIALLLSFTVYTYRRARSSRREDGGRQEAPRGSYARPLLFLGVGVALLYVGAELTVDNAVLIAEEFGIPKRVVGITVIAVGTSLPELITSIIAIRKGHTDIGIGNIIGSNIYNILMIMGVASAMAGIAVPPDAFYDYAIMVAFSLALFLGLVSGVIGRRTGAGLAAAYFAYLAFNLLR